MGKVEIFTFGSVRAKTPDGEPVWFRTRKTASLFGYLASHLGKEVARETLTSIFWPEAEDSFARNSLSVALTSLRRQLEKDGGKANHVLVSDTRTVSLNPDNVWCDSHEFQRFLKKARLVEGDQDRQQALFEALDLYDSPFLLGDEEDWARLERMRLEQTFHQVLCRVLDGVQTEEDIHRALTHAGKALAWDPKNADITTRIQGLRQKIGVTGPLVTKRKKSPAPQLQDTEDLKYIRNLLESPAEEIPSSAGENLGGAVPLNSPYYLERDSDATLADAIAQKESIVLIKGPRQIGKSSLLARGIDHARSLGASVLLTDFQSMDSDCLASSKGLYIWLISIFLDQLGLQERPEAFWDEQLTPGINLERFVRDKVLGEGNAVFWGLDEADRVFACSFRSDFFGLLRSWHNRRAMDPRARWSNLTVAVTYATEAHFFIDDLNQSPFNVGISLELADFDLKGLAELNRRYHNPLKNLADLQELSNLVGGHPYLARKALFELADKKGSLDQLAREATSDTGPFADHLRRLGLMLQESVDVVPDVRALMAGQPLSGPNAFYRLRSAGLVTGQSLATARIRCGLYQRFLKEKMR